MCGAVKRTFDLTARLPILHIFEGNSKDGFINLLKLQHQDLTVHVCGYVSIDNIINYTICAC